MGSFRLGPYEILRKLGVGGMGTVYAAVRRDEQGCEKLVAIKQLHPHLELDPEARRFINEARIGTKLSHPNLVSVFGLEELEGTTCIVMEYVRGCTLGQLMRARRGAIPLREALLIASEILAGLEAIHGYRTWSGDEQPIIHRDISPKNVLLSASGEVKITDLGIAQIGEASTSVGLRGTYSYMSPEQANCEPLDPRSDLYSAGIVLFEMVTAQRGYPGGSDVQTLERARAGLHGRVASSVGDVELAAVLALALAHRPEDRFPDAASFRHALDEILERRGRPTRDALAVLVAPLAISVEDLVAPVTDAAGGAGPATVVLSEPQRPERVARRIWAVSLGLLVAAVGIVAATLAFLSAPESTGRAVEPSRHEHLPRVQRLDPPDAGRAPGPDTAARDAPDAGRAPHPDTAAKLAPDAARRVAAARRERGTLRINTTPSWSRVIIDGKERGTTPLVVTLPAGSHVVTVRSPGGKTRTVRVRVLPDQVTTRILELAP